MNTTENLLETAGESPLVITEDAKYYLKKAGQWASFLGIVGFVMTGLIAILALFIGTIFTTMAQFNPMMGAMAGMGGLMTVIYLLFALFNFFFALYLYQFGSRIKKAVMFTDSAEAGLAFSKLKSFFKLWGITIIVVLSFYALAIVIGIVGGLAGLMFAHH